MIGKSGDALRCAIYTRKSTEHGLELEFNSLDAQREACEAYIKSQASEGWRRCRPATMIRPIPAAISTALPCRDCSRISRPVRVDVVVVYKIDRLTRSLADFAKLVEIFDAKYVSFVAVTQQFNTTTSMGRLTLNVLLSFAQFERELASERVRDKLAASRKKGKWTGGSVPLGYDSQRQKARRQSGRSQYRPDDLFALSCPESFQKLIDELDDKGIVTKKRADRRQDRGRYSVHLWPPRLSPKNRTYLGETGHGGRWFPASTSRSSTARLFDEVQRLLKSNSAGSHGRRHESGALLTGVLFDDRGNRMSPSFSTKAAPAIRSTSAPRFSRDARRTPARSCGFRLRTLRRRCYRPSARNSRFLAKTTVSPRLIWSTTRLPA